MGKLIVIEGTDGSGKSTQFKQLVQRLEAENKPFRRLVFPRYSEESSALIRMYLGGQFGTTPSDVNAYAASTFYAVDRYASFKKHWQKEYDSDKIIVANRYTTSNASHQMTKLTESEWDNYLDWLFSFEYKQMEIPEPDCVIFLDMPVEISQKLLMKRYEGDIAKKDVHERDVEYLKACHKAAEYASKKLNWNVILCGENGEPFSFEYISEKVYDSVKKEIL